MKGYKTYKEAKEKHPDCEIIRPTQKNIDEFNEPDLFHPVIENCLYSDGYEYLLKKDQGPRIGDGYWCFVGGLKPRTKAEFVKCEFECAWHAIKALEDGEELYTKRSHKDFVIIDNAPDVLRFLYDLHRKVETEIDERQEFIDAYARKSKMIPRCYDGDIAGYLFDSGKFKLVG